MKEFKSSIEKNYTNLNTNKCNKTPMQWRSNGGQVGARALGRRPWGRTSTLFAVI